MKPNWAEEEIFSSQYHFNISNKNPFFSRMFFRAFILGSIEDVGKKVEKELNVRSFIFKFGPMLSRKTKYGIKALAYIAKKEEKKPVQTAEIARSENISHKFLENILVSLRKAGFLGSKKGKGGGYYLIKPPNEIKMTEVIRELEGPIAMLPCVSLNYYERCEDCPDEASCSVHTLMIQVRDSTLKVLGGNTLRDIAVEKKSCTSK